MVHARAKQKHAVGCFATPYLFFVGSFQEKGGGRENGGLERSLALHPLFLETSDENEVRRSKTPYGVLISGSGIVLPILMISGSGIVLPVLMISSTGMS